MSELTKPEMGTRDVCKSCKSPIFYSGRCWEHIGPNVPRHPAVPSIKVLTTESNAKNAVGDRYASAVTGLFVSKEYADANPETTYAVQDRKRDDLRIFFNAFSFDVLERMQEQLSENTDKLPDKMIYQSELCKALESKRGNNV